MRGTVSSAFYLEHAVTKAQIVQICAELMLAFPNDTWAPQARCDGFLAASDAQYMRLGDNHNPRWRWPHVSSNSLEEWGADETMAVPPGIRYHMTFTGLSTTKFRVVKNVLTRYGFTFHRGMLRSASRELRLLRSYREAVSQCEGT
jgi:hypothetical protein